MTWRPLPDGNDARRAIEGVEKQFSALRSADMARLVIDQHYPTEALIEEAIRVTDWALSIGGITQWTHDMRVSQLKERMG